ncbi:MAG: DUF4827 family protein [Paludibacteraceae bacterium]|nr:DUF4827 family protein [Paludibacteraceae bacterium]
MKKAVNFFLCLMSLFLLFSSCSDRKTYAELLKDEKKIIADYIERNNIQVVTTFPKINEWGEKVYVKTASGLYFHLVNPGDTSANADTVAQNDLVIVRYIQYTLTVPADTISNWNTIDYPYPFTFNYLDYSQACQAFHEAVSYMKRNDSEAKIIVPSKIGFSEYMNSVTPLGYDLKIKIQKY